MKLAFCFVGSLFLVGNLNWVVASDHDTLVALQLLIRHGNRTSETTLPEFVPWYVKTFEPFQFGQLTPCGRRQSFNTGSYIRQRYNHFLPDEFSYSEILVRCTGMQRIMEASAVTMAAMFPPKNKQEWQDSGLGALYTPIPCDYLPESQDIFLEPDSVNCTRYAQRVDEIYNSPEYLEKYNELIRNGTVTEYVRQALNLTESLTSQQMETLYDNLMTIEGNGLPLPDWSKAVYPQPLRSLGQLRFASVYTDPECVRFGAGEFMKEILAIATSLEQNLPAPPKKKVYAYIGHDNLLYPMLFALGFETYPPIVTFAAAIIMELHRNKTTNEIGYKFLYRNETWSDPIMYTVPGCQEICPLSSVRKQLAPYIPTRPFLEYC